MWIWEKWSYSLACALLQLCILSRWRWLIALCTALVISHLEWCVRIRELFGNRDLDKCCEYLTFPPSPHYRHQIPACSDLWSSDAGIKLISNQKHLPWNSVWEPEMQSSREYSEFILTRRIKPEAVDPWLNREASWLSHAPGLVSSESHGIYGEGMPSQHQPCVQFQTLFPGCSSPRHVRGGDPGQL